MSSSDSAADQSSAPDQDEESGGALRFVREVAIVLVCALLLSVVVRTFFVQAFYVPSASMENTLLINDRILASKISTRISGVNRGEVVVFKDPGGWLPPSTSTAGPVAKAMEFIGLLPSSAGDDLVKRVIGVGGDSVMCCDTQGQIVLNGVGLVEPYIKPGAGTEQVQFDIVVPADSVFVMGDNRGSSADSRYHLEQNDGAVPVENVVGRVVLKVWPFSQFGTVPIPPVPFDNPALNNQSGATPTPTATKR
ncbi:MAG: signal peptidase I [Candidatus Nanopelagicales bacterium]